MYRLALIALLASTIPARASEGPPRAETVFTRQTTFAIPFQIERPTAQAREPVEIELFVSQDRGRSWQSVSKAKPAQRSFAFRAGGEGEYWFRVETTDAEGRTRSGESQTPELRVVVDASAPAMEISARQGPAGEVICQWLVRDGAIDPASFKLEQQTGGPTALWRTVATDPLSSTPDLSAYSGQVTWWPHTSVSEVVMRAEVSDRAGNRTLRQFRIETNPSVASGNGASGGDRVAKPTADSDWKAPKPWPADEQTRGSFAAVGRGEEIPAPAPRASGIAPVSQSKRSDSAAAPVEEEIVPPTGARGSAAGPVAPAEDLPAPLGTSAPVMTAPPQALAESGSPPFAAPSAAPGETQMPPPLAEPYRDASEPIGAPSGAASIDVAPPAVEGPALGQAAPGISTSPRGPSARVQSAAPARGSAGERGPLFDLSYLPRGQKPQILNTRRFELDYDVADVGSSGISRVELWGTRDGGRTWESYAIDDDRQSPIVVALHQEGVYGLRITVRSGAGVGGQPPVSGDAPDVWIGVDVTKPFARIVSAEQGLEGQAGQMTIRWEAADELLAVNPISLAYSPTPAGPWVAIAEAIDNTGEFAWRLDDGVPEQFFLRLTVRDEAGNVQDVDTRQPVTLDRLRPQGHIRQVRPVAGTP